VKKKGANPVPRRLVTYSLPVDAGFDNRAEGFPTFGFRPVRDTLPDEVVSLCPGHLHAGGGAFLFTGGTAWIVLGGM
jgi:hypothetical protein